MAELVQGERGTSTPSRLSKESRGSLQLEFTTLSTDMSNSGQYRQSTDSLPGQRYSSDSADAKQAPDTEVALGTSTGPFEHLVICVTKNDTLQGICIEHDVSLYELMSLNNISGDQVWPGQKIILPKMARCSSVVEQPSTLRSEKSTPTKDKKKFQLLRSSSTPSDYNDNSSSSSNINNNNSSQDNFITAASPYHEQLQFVEEENILLSDEEFLQDMQKSKQSQKEQPMQSISQRKFVGVNLLDTNSDQQTVQKTLKYPFYYLTDEGHIYGYLVLTAEMILFMPDLYQEQTRGRRFSFQREEDFQKQKKKDKQNKEGQKFQNLQEKVQKFNMRISHAHINEARLHILNNDVQSALRFLPQQHQFVLQIMLSDPGNRKLRKKHARRLIAMRAARKPIACVYLMIAEKDLQDNPYTENQKQEIVQQLVEVINCCAQHDHEDEKQSHTQSGDRDRTKSCQLDLNLHLHATQSNESLTEIPYIDILEDNLNLQREENVNGGSSSNELTASNILQSTIEEEQKCNALAFTPELKNASNTITQEIFFSILAYIPAFFRCTNWELAYSTFENGSSLQTLFRNCQERAPFFLVIKDMNDNIFGAYGSDPIKIKESFYGCGECFLFSYDTKTSTFVHYPSTIKNTNYIYSNTQNGIGFGTGQQHYGLFIHPNLSKGYSYECETYNNKILSQMTDFDIRYLEIWSPAL